MDYFTQKLRLGSHLRKYRLSNIDSKIGTCFIVYRSLNGWSGISFIHFWQAKARTRARITWDGIKRGDDILVAFVNNAYLTILKHYCARRRDQIRNKALKSFRYDFIFYGNFTHSIFYDYARCVIEILLSWNWSLALRTIKEPRFIFTF